MPFKRRKNRKSSLIRVGDDVVREFIAALNNRVLVLSLQQEAEYNEQRTLDTLAAAGSLNNVYVTPQDIPLDQQADVAKASLNAHMQKAQAHQAEVFNNTQQRTRNELLTERYKGHKIIVRVISRHRKAVITYWNDSLTGRRYSNESAPQRLKGTIEAIDLGGNTITVRPNLFAKSMNRSIHHHQVFIVDPVDMTPLVSLKIA